MQPGREAPETRRLYWGWLDEVFTNGGAVEFDRLRLFTGFLVWSPHSLSIKPPTTLVGKQFLNL
jgi:hypothetical protein